MRRHPHHTWLDAPDTTQLLLAALLSLPLFLATPAAGHEPVASQIEEAAERLTLAPGSANAYLERAELLRLAGQWEAAAEDLVSAACLGAERATLLLCRAQLFADQGLAAQALVEVDDALLENPARPEAWLLRSRLHESASEPAAAAEDLARGLKLLPAPSPAQDLRYARLLVAAGESRVPEALVALEAGIARHGPIVTLAVPAARLEARLGRYDAALARLRALEEGVERPEILWAESASVLQAAGRELEAQVLYTRIVESLESGDRRKTPALAELAGKARRALAAQPSMGECR